MTIRARGRSALILAAGLLVCFAEPSQIAAASNDTVASSKSETAGASTRHASRHWKGHSHRKFSRTALKASRGKKAASREVAAEERGKSSAIPPAVANANAQLIPNDTPAGNARAMSARANEILQAAPTSDVLPAGDAPVVSADQLNDVDRTLRESTPPASSLTMAAAEVPTARTAPIAITAASSDEVSTWDKTSLIGKIFIGFGALLTMASAARMFMA
jgi:hypothetical protein